MHQERLPRILAVILLFVICACAPRAFSQATSGTIQGTVSDSTGAVVIGATVTVKNDATGLVRSAGTEAAGYTLYNLPPGTYSITVAMAGFKKDVRHGILLVIDQKLKLDFQLMPGSANETITVTGQAPLLQTQTMETGEVIQSRQILDLPLLSRDFLQLAKLTPGVLTGSGGNGVNLTVNGQREFANSVVIDGIESTGNRNNDSGLRPSVDAVEEFKIETSAYSAEYGRAAGGVISIETKSGSNRIHGSLYEFYRPSNTAAANYTFNGPPERSQLKQHSFGVTLGGPIKKDKMFFFGSFEGFRDRDVFVYADSVPPAGQINYLGDGGVDLSGLVDPSTGNQIPIFDPATTPDCYDAPDYYVFCSPARFEGNIIPGDRVSAAGRAVLQNFFPAPNLPGDPNSFGWISNYQDRQTFKENFNNIDSRFDWTLSSKDRLSVVYHYGDYIIQTGDRYAGHIPVEGGGDGDASENDNARDQGVSLTETHSFSDHWLNEFRTGYSRFRLAQLTLMNGRNLSDQFGMGNIFVPGYAATAGFPDVYMGTGFFTGGSSYKPLLFLDNNIQVSDSIAAKLGHHDFKAGGDFRRLRSNPNFSLYPTGFQYYGGPYGSLTSDPSYNVDGLGFYDPAATYGTGGSDIADILLGLPQSVSIGLQFTNPTSKSWEMEFYGQDSWQVTPSLVLSYGLRYEFQKPYGEVNNNVSNFDPTTLSVLIGGRGGNSGTLVVDDRNNFAPRVGVSYQINSRTVIRAGYGVYFTPENDARSDALTKNYPFAVQQLYTNGYTNANNDPPTEPYPYELDAGIPRLTEVPLASGASSIAAADIIAGPTQSLFYVDPHFRTGYSQLFNFTVQQALSQNTSFELGYVGSLSRKLPYAVGDINRIDPETASPRITGLLGQINAQFPIGSGHYHSMQAKLTKRFSNHISSLVAYTWSKNIDNGPAPFNLGSNRNRNNQPQDPLNLAAERAVADSDVTHNLVVSAIYELPFGKGQRFFGDWHGARQSILGGWQMNTIFSARTGLPVNVVQAAQQPISPGLRPNLIADPILPRSQRTLDRYFNTNAFCVTEPGCPELGPNGIGDAGRNPVRGPGFVNFDYSLFKDFSFSESKKLQLRFEAFNLLNTPHFANPEGDFGNKVAFGRIRGTIENPRILQFAAKFLF